MSNKNQAVGQSTIALNKKAKFDFFLTDRYEAGIVLEGWEVKALRAGKAQLTDAHILLKNGEAFMIGGQINPLLQASSHVRPDNTRIRKLLLNRREIDQIVGAVERKGYTVVPTALYWKNGRAKLEIALAQGKKEHDKRATLKDRDWARDKQRILRTSS
ncbi:MAG: SsrA-binding protein SmpB [Halothiobacillus sp.]|jgi:SsrA-binding protein|uniref:SsrA-binding protein SmpB n=1 Tax=Halothiobacillus sp. TaxID=1891311 RepID=UPI002AD1DE08|nr:SsrA-binding protein SmpB [Halothiobacillus sp.]MDA3878558.1 SsrA-binding protein SmpB [Halothiobacillus sp.]